MIPTMRKVRTEQPGPFGFPKAKPSASAKKTFGFKTAKHFFVERSMESIRISN